MSSISFKLDSFEGPLDLLLHLISKHKLNIYDIEISLLLDQYMEYMNQLEADDFESAAEFLEMAARLIYIKTCSLLPQPEEAQELKKELEGRIIEYSLCKQAAAELKKLYAGGLIYVRNPLKLPVNNTYTRTHEASVLYDAYLGISSKVKTYKPLRANVFSPIVSHRIVSVTSKIIFVLKKLYKTGKCEMFRLYEGINDKSEKVATFLAVLELTKSGRIFINSDNTEIRFQRPEKKRSADIPTTDNSENLQSESASDENYQSDDIDNFTENYEELLQPQEESTALAQDSCVSEMSDHDETERSCPENSECEFASGMNCPKRKPAVKFSSERITTEHTVSVRLDCDMPRAVAAYAPVLSEACTEKTENETHINEVVEEISTITEPPVTLFKPNYWSASRCYWGFTPVRDNAQGNYWRFGRKTFFGT